MENLDNIDNLNFEKLKITNEEYKIIPYMNSDYIKNILEKVKIIKKSIYQDQ